MVEQTYGPRWGKILLTLIVAGLVALSINAVFEKLLIPVSKTLINIYEYISHQAFPFSSFTSKYMPLFTIFLAVSLAILFWRHVWTANFVRKKLTELKEIIDRANQELDTKGTAFVKRYQDNEAAYKIIIADLKKKNAELEKKLAQKSLPSP